MISELLGVDFKILIFWELTVEGRSWICFDSSLAILCWSYKKLYVPEPVGYFCRMDSCPVFYHLCSLWTNHLMTSLRTDIFLDYGFIIGKLWWIIIRGMLACQSTVSKLGAIWRINILSAFVYIQVDHQGPLKTQTAQNHVLSPHCQWAKFHPNWSSTSHQINHI